jgi:hypothetical protein
MIRFAITVTAVEIALTLGASVWIACSETGEPFVTPGDFTELGIPVEKYSTERGTRFGSLFSYDTRAVARDSGTALHVSLRVNTPREEYDVRESGERHPRLREGDERPIVNDESWPGEPGFAVRHVGRTTVRTELTRLHGAQMLIVRATLMKVPEANPNPTASACEHLARLLQDYMVQKLGWRN